MKSWLLFQETSALALPSKETGKPPRFCFFLHLHGLRNEVAGAGPEQMRTWGEGALRPQWWGGRWEEHFRDHPCRQEPQGTNVSP